LGTAWTARNLRWRGSSTEPADIRSEVALRDAPAYRVATAGDPPRTGGQVPAKVEQRCPLAGNVWVR